MSIEIALGYDYKGRTLFTHKDPEATAAHIPHNLTLWDKIWDNRHRLVGIAHSHPQHVGLTPSFEDLTTFQTVTTGLARILFWPIANADEVKVYMFVPHCLDALLVNYPMPFDLGLLREMSNFKQEEVDHVQPSDD